MAEAAKQRVLAGFADFDAQYETLEREVNNGLWYNDAVKRLNALIAFLNPLGANFNAIGLKNIFSID